jgi:Protein of unknown function (DUF4089)
MDADDIERHVDATAALIGLPLAPEHRPGVLMYFALAARLAQPLMDFPLGVEDEPAEVFIPLEPPK